MRQKDNPPLVRIMALPAFRNRKYQPYQALLYERLIALGPRVVDFSASRLLLGRYDIWHIHWPESVFHVRRAWQARARATVLLLLIQAVRAKGTKVVWTIHTVAGHERPHPALEPWFWDRFSKSIDGCIAPSRRALLEATQRYPALRDVPRFIIPLGHYRGVYPDEVTRAEARQRLGVRADAPVLLFIGQIRPYRGIPRLLEVFRTAAELDAYLIIAGQPATEELGRDVSAAAEGDARVRLHLGFVPEEALQVFLRAADVVILPYREFLHSSSALLALSYDRPVVVPERGAMAELRDAAGGEWVFTYTGELTADILLRALEWACQTRRDPSRLFEGLSWDGIARQTLAAYETILRGGVTPASSAPI